MTDEHGRDRLAAAQRRAQAALRGSTDPALRAERERLRRDVEVPPDSPARVTRAFSHLLDDLVTIPGTSIRVGVDPLLSLVPAAGTAVGAAMGGVVLVDALRLRVPVPVFARMLGNYVVDWMLGLIPLLGALLDVGYRSNRRNLRLLQRVVSERDRVRRSSVLYWITVAVMLLAVLTLIIAVPVALLWWFAQWAKTVG